MNFYKIDIVLQEVPGELSICFSICGCTLNCSGCHSPYLWKESNGVKLTDNFYKSTLEKYSAYATCVLFFGGEWHQQELIRLLKTAKILGYKTCLYTGEDKVSKKLLKELTWIKTGKWIQKLGGLASEKTNQQFIEVATNKKQNYLFKKK